MQIDAKLALLILEELALRNGRVRKKYLKTYRMLTYWKGSEYSRKILNKLVEGRYLKIDGEYIVLLKTFKVNKSLNSIYREMRKVLASTS
ncbi:MAG: hypothetical protein B6V02_00015 [Thermoprotei archaeon ex4572_64]|nr:MAG: hypothetical protein B6V02_00015 [Thermoprotei archaeon ex4572_64]